jgi:erythronate-4-phosphate dehydrogenase
MPYALEAFSTLGDVVAADGRTITPAMVKDADILAIRSTTRVDSVLLGGSRVRFVGSAVIGTDHLDTDYLTRRGVRWCSAAGCNANSVSEYLTVALLRLATRHGFTLEGRTVGVIGVGNVGRRVVSKAEALGIRVLMNDPPRARAEGPSGFVDLDTVLAQSDVVTLHVPLTKDGPDATRHLAGEGFFRRLKPSTIFINAARGAVTVSKELLLAMDRGTVSHIVMDCWEGEPAYRLDVLDRADLATPHIAGHSFEGKVAGTVMVYRAACEFLGVKPTWTPDALLPPPEVPEVVLDAAGMTDEQALWRIVRQVYDIEADDRRLSDGAVADDAVRAAHFDRLRKDYPMRREFRFTRVSLRNASVSLRRKVELLGFRIGD